LFGFGSADSGQQTADTSQTVDSRQQILVQQTTDSSTCLFWLGGFDSADSGGQQSTGASSSRQTAVKNGSQMKGGEIHQDEAGVRPEERVQRERLGEKRTGGRMPRETHKAVRDAQQENGSIWRKEEVRPGGLEEGSEKEIGPKRQMEGSRRGRTSAPAM
jgi:hypothetical protein